MSKFKANDNVVCVNNQHNTGILTIGKTYKIIELSKCEEYAQFIGDNGQRCSVFCSRFELSKPSTLEKPAKKHTETDRRKAAKDVRALEAKLKMAVEKAKATGIDVECTGIYIGLTFQPETPKKRVY
jgi:hypothetical protein